MMRLGDMKDFTRQKFRIITKSIRDGRDAIEVEVDGIVAYGLGLHIGYDQAHVTHLASGRRIASFSTLGGAMDFVGAVAAMDWRILPSLQQAKDLIKLADEIEANSPRPREVEA